MCQLKPGIKKDPERRWALPDRVFFENGACAILAGALLRQAPLPGFYAERIIPGEGFSGNHIYVTDGVIAFDYHGYSLRNHLLLHHTSGWAGRYAEGWHCLLERVNFDLLDTRDLNNNKMLGPDQYLHDPVVRAQKFLDRIDHVGASARARAKLAEILTVRRKPRPVGGGAGPCEPHGVGALCRWRVRA